MKLFFGPSYVSPDYPLVGRLLLERGLDGGELLRVVSVKDEIVTAYVVSSRAAHVRELTFEDAAKFYALVPKDSEARVIDVHMGELKAPFRPRRPSPTSLPGAGVRRLG